MAHIAELLGVTPAEVYGTASFYEMFKFEPVGRYCINVCTNISCQLLGAWELLEHAEERLGVKAGGTTADGLFTLEDVECIAACTEAPALQVNYRYRYKVTHDDFDQLVDDLARRPARPTRSRPTARWPASASSRRRPLGRHRRRGPGRRSTPDERHPMTATRRSSCRAWCRPGRHRHQPRSTQPDGYTLRRLRRAPAGTPRCARRSRR